MPITLPETTVINRTRPIVLPSSVNIGELQITIRFSDQLQSEVEIGFRRNANSGFEFD